VLLDVISGLQLLRFIQIDPFVVRLGRKRRDYSAAVGWRKPEPRKQAGELRRLGSRDSTGPELRHSTDDDFRGPAVRMSCDTRRNHLGELAPCLFLLVCESPRWAAELLCHDRLSRSGFLAILVVDEGATSLQNGRWCAV
jgi:hypothetical protein